MRNSMKNHCRRALKSWKRPHRWRRANQKVNLRDRIRAVAAHVPPAADEVAARRKKPVSSPLADTNISLAARAVRARKIRRAPNRRRKTNQRPDAKSLMPVL